MTQVNGINGRPHRNHGHSKEHKRESRPISKCPKDEGHDYLPEIGEVTVDGKIVDVVTSVIFLGALTTRDGLRDKNMRRRTTKGKLQ